MAKSSSMNRCWWYSKLEITNQELEIENCYFSSSTHSLIHSLTTIMLYSAFIVGLLGSFHCLGMCGPVAFALPLKRESKWQAFTGKMLYNTGRISTYALLGLLIGTFGQSLTFATSQQKLSLAIGLFILIFFILPSQFTRQLNLFSPIATFTSGIKQQFRSYFLQKSNKALFILGVLNGLLPCGLIYVALAGALAMGNSLNGMAYMALFGLGTLPMMLTASMAGSFISVQWRAKLTKVVPVFTVVMAFLFILRGLDLGIPVLSPQVSKTKTEVNMNCCHKKPVEQNLQTIK